MSGEKVGHIKGENSRFVGVQGRLVVSRQHLPANIAGISETAEPAAGGKPELKEKTPVCERDIYDQHRRMREASEGLQIGIGKIMDYLSVYPAPGCHDNSTGPETEYLAGFHVGDFNMV